MDKIAGVEPIEAKLDAMQARFVARSLGHPAAMEGLWPADFEGSQEERGAGRHWTDHEDSGWLAGTDGFETVADRMVEKLELEGGEEISWGGTCRTVKVLTNKVGNGKMSKKQWEERIKDITMGGNYDLAITDGSNLEDGKAGAGWTIRNQFSGGRGLGDRATVWDRRGFSYLAIPRKR